jgi:hydrogenase maturation protease
LVLAIGNTLRADDGVADHVADLLDTRARVEVQRVHQLTPELAEKMTGAQIVVFVDADADAAEARLQRLTPVARHSPVSHAMTPGELILLAGRLFGFRGPAYLCRVPARDFTPGGALSEAAEAGVGAAARLVLAILANHDD